MNSSNNIQDSNFTKVANLKDFEDRNLIKVDAKGKSVVLVMVNGQIHAINSICSHQDGPLEEGTLDGYNLKCPWHNAIFDVRNGKVSETTGWASDQESYEVKKDDKTGDIFLRV